MLTSSRRFVVHTAPIVIGLIQGPMAETEFRRAKMIFIGKWTALFTHPRSAALVVLAVAALFGPELLPTFPLLAWAAPEHVPELLEMRNTQ